MISKIIQWSILLVFIPFISQAHYLWIESMHTGKVGQKHTVKVFFGEYTYGVIEEVAGEHYKNVNNFKLWLIDPAGEKTLLEVQPQADHYAANFTPKKEGTYTVALNNDEIDVLDYTQYDFGVFKTHYHSTAQVLVGKSDQASAKSNENGLSVIDLSKGDYEKEGEAHLQILYKGQPIAEQEVDIYISDLWSKKLTTDEEGKISFKLPWATKYIIETTKKEEVPGAYKGEDYEFIWHCATYSINL